MGKWYDRYIMMSLYSFAVIRTVASKLVWIYWLVLFIHDHRKMVKIGWAKNTIKICRLVFREMASAANDPKNVVIESAFVTFFLFSSVHEVIKNPVSFQYYLAQVHFCESFANSGSIVETVLRSCGQRARLGYSVDPSSKPSRVNILILIVLHDFYESLNLWN